MGYKVITKLKRLFFLSLISVFRSYILYTLGLTFLFTNLLKNENDFKRFYTMYNKFLYKILKFLN